MTRRGPALLAALAVLFLAAGAGQGPTPATTPESPVLQLPRACPSLFERLDPGRPVPAPRLRVGLRGSEAQVRVGATAGPFRLLDGRTGQELWPERAPGVVTVVPEGDAPAASRRVYRVQVGAFTDEAAATRRAGELEAAAGAVSAVGYDAMRGVWRVRVGEGTSAAALADTLAAVRAAGVRDAWIASEAVPAAATAAAGLRLVDARWESRPAGTDRVVVVPAGETLAVVDGRPYRGLVEVQRTVAGGVVAVNEVNLEDYLRGVVPDELGPAAFPELQALAAQAVAARTYAVANLGQYAADGYDLCDTPRCQVYGGAGSEHPLSDQAVRETAGMVLAWDGRPINALFTSTCGGHTEDVEAVFPEQSHPYLRGVPCRAPHRELEDRVVALDGRAVEREVERAATVEADTLPLLRLVAAGLVPREALAEAWRGEPVAVDEAFAWFAALARRTARREPPALAGPPARVALWNWSGDLLGVAVAEGSAVAPGDEDIVLQVADRDAVPAPSRARAAALLTAGVIRPGADGRLDPDGIPSRGEVLGWIARAAERLEAVPLLEATFERRGGDAIVLKLRAGRREIPAGGEPPDLLVEAAGAWHRVPRLELLPGDRVVALVEQGRLALLGLRERKGAADDRSSPRFRWTIARDREALETRLAELAPVGTLHELRVLRRGRSGRVAQLELRGSGGTAVVEGFRFTRAVDLPETQFGLDLQRDAAGGLRRVVFSGRGWGHGVGLCQYGAFGMAQRGANARQILAHYYTGAGLVRLPVPAGTP